MKSGYFAASRLNPPATGRVLKYQDAIGKKIVK
jgi:hypothetical protein